MASGASDARAYESNSRSVIRTGWTRCARTCSTSVSSSVMIATWATYYLTSSGTFMKAALGATF